MSYENSEEAIIRCAEQYIEANLAAAWFTVPSSVYELTKLKITDTKGISTFEPLKKFTKLSVLFIGDQSTPSLKIPSLKGLEAAEHLERLSFNSPTVIEHGIEAIDQLKKLKRLGLYHVQQSLPSNLLASLDQLIVVTFSPENYKSIKALPSNLHEIALNFDGVDHLPNWDRTPSVRKIIVGRRNCALKTLDSLAIFPNVQHIELNRPKQLNNIDQVAQLKQLEQLEINLSGITDLSPLANHPSLEILKIRSSYIKTLSSLASCDKLHTLHADKSTLNSIEGIEQITTLKSLWIGETKVSDLAPLNENNWIEELNLSELGPTSWETLQTLTGLKTLDLSHSSFSNTSLLFRLPCLQFVNLTGCPVDRTSNQYVSFANKIRAHGQLIED